jgi:hypothetical protein
MAMDDRDGDREADDERAGPPTVSRLNRTGDRRYRALHRTTGRSPFPRLRRQLPIAELIGRLIERHGLTDEVRQRCVCLYWSEIVGERIAAKTFPARFFDGVLQVSAINSTWVHELRFLKAQLITDINDWVDANRVWLGPPPLVLDMRFALAMRQRDPLVDRERMRRLHLHQARRLAPRAAPTPPVASDVDREAIRAETSAIVDPELRAMIESVRLKWNR